MAGDLADLADMSAADLVAASERSLAQDFNRDTVLTALHVAANRARGEGRSDEAILLFRQILRHNTNDHNVRAALADYAVAAEDYEAVEQWLDPVYPLLKADPAHGRTLRLLVDARLRAGRLTDLDDLVGQAATWGAGERRSEMLQHRVEVLDRFALSTAGADRADHPFARLLRSAVAAASEYDMRRILNDARALAGDGAKVGLDEARTLLAVVALCRRFGWRRPLAAAMRMLDEAADETRAAIPAALWHEASLSIGAAAWTRDRAASAAARATALRGFADDPGIDTARAVWRMADTLPEWSPLTNRSPRSDEDAGNPGPMASLWYMITWHEGADRLIRLAAMLAAPHVSVVVSVGGAGVPAEIGKLSTLLLLDGAQILFRPVVTWGGQKLLYRNTYEVMRGFVRSGADWLHVICNRSFPLMGPREAARALAEPDFIRRFPGVPGPPAWRGEWPDEVVDRLDERYNEALDGVFGAGDLALFRSLADADYKLNSSVFNFSDKAEVLERNFKDDAHGYLVSPFGTDMRWMSFSRLGAFVDVSSETGKTFTRRLDPTVARWVRQVIDRNELRTGDPFVLMSSRYAQVALDHPEAIELYAAMDLGFAPEMNFFDTLAMTERFGLREEMAHTYCRNDQQEARDEDVGRASIGADVDRLMFMRKTWPSVSAEFVANFADKVGAEWPAGDLFAAVSFTSPTPGLVVPSPRDLLEPLLPKLPLRLRTLTGELIADARLDEDGRIGTDAGVLGNWFWEGDGLTLRFADETLGTKIYRRATADARSLVLVPAELVSARNGWSVFIDVPLTAIARLGGAEAQVVVNRPLIDAEAVGWRTGRSAPAVVFDSFVDQDHSDYRIPVDRSAGRLIEARQAGGGILALCDLAGEPVLFRVEETIVAGGRTVMLMTRARIGDDDAWAAALPGDLSIALAGADLAGRYNLGLLTGVRAVTLLDDGRIADAEGAPVGSWSVAEGAVWLFGLDGLRFAAATQFQRRSDGRWRLTGWGWADVEDRVTFSFTPV